ncbi:Uncharacterised protein [uncultured archaeon]|nr:Uncharacterised protein [uncultured archaeon]
MKGVLDHLGIAHKEPLSPRDSSRNGGIEQTDKELCAAKEILSEVFGISLAEVEDMIKRRSEERMVWPERLHVGETASE